MARALRSSVVDAAVDAYDRHVGRYGPERFKRGAAERLGSPPGRST